MPASCRKEIVSSGNHTAKLKQLSKLIEDADEVSLCKDSDDVSVNDDTTDGHSSAEEFIDDEERYDHQLWFLLCAKCFKYDLSINECMFRTLTLYFALEKDDPYQEIMKDVEKKEKQVLSFVSRLVYWLMMTLNAFYV